VSEIRYWSKPLACVTCMNSGQNFPEKKLLMRIRHHRDMLLVHFGM